MVNALAAQQGAWICFEDEAGQTLRPPRGRTWGRCGHTPVVRVSGKGSGRISIAGLLAYRSGDRPHLYYRLVVHRGRRGERRSLSEADYVALLSAAHQQLRACHDSRVSHGFGTRETIFARTANCADSPCDHPQQLRPAQCRPGLFPRLGSPRPVAAVLAVVAAVALTELSWPLVEQPFLRLKPRFNRPVATAALSSFRAAVARVARRLYEGPTRLRHFPAPAASAQADPGSGVRGSPLNGQMTSQLL